MNINLRRKYVSNHITHVNRVFWLNIDIIHSGYQTYLQYLIDAKDLLKCKKLVFLKLHYIFRKIIFLTTWFRGFVCLFVSLY